MDEKRVKARVRAREAVENLFTFVPDVWKDAGITTTFSKETFWEVLAEETAAKLGKKLTDEVHEVEMSEQAASEFESVRVPSGYGMIEGRKVREVPTAHWIRLFESVFGRKLVRYMRSKRFQDRQRAD